MSVMQLSAVQAKLHSYCDLRSSLYTSNSENTEESSNSERSIVAKSRQYRINLRNLFCRYERCLYPLHAFHSIPGKRFSLLSSELSKRSVLHYSEPEYNFALEHPRLANPSVEVIRAKTLVLIHPPVRSSDFKQLEIYLSRGIDDNRKVKFVKVCLQRNQESPSNLQVHFTHNSSNPLFESYIANESNRQKSIRSPIEEYLAINLPDDRRNSHPRPSELCNSNSENILALAGQRQSTLRPLAYQQLPCPTRPLPNPGFAFPQVQSDNLFQQSVDLPPNTPSPCKDGYVTVCSNCGLRSRLNRDSCHRCRKPTYLALLADLAPRNKKSYRRLSRSQEIVELSSGEEEDSGNPYQPQEMAEDFPVLSGALNGNAKKTKSDLAKERMTTELIELLSGVTTKGDTTVAYQVLPCEFIQVGNYKVSSTPKMFLTITFAALGIYFELPGCASGNMKKVGIPTSQIINVTGYLGNPKLAFFEVFVGPSQSLRVREAIEMEGCKEYNLCPFSQFNCQKCILIKFLDFDLRKRPVIQNFFKTLKEISNYNEARTRLKNQMDLTLSIEPDRKTAPAPIVPAVATTLFHYPLNTDKANAIVVNSVDIPCLGNEQYINDQMIDFWINHIVEQLSPERKKKVHMFSSFFYKRLTTRERKRPRKFYCENDAITSVAERRHARVKNWTKNVDIFEKDFLLIPVNEASHWFFVVICFPGMKRPTVRHNKSAGSTQRCQTHQDDDWNMDEEEHVDGDDICTGAIPNNASNSVSILSDSQDGDNHVKAPCILVFDSLGGDSRGRFFQTIREYLQVEYDSRKTPGGLIFNRITFPGKQPIIPTQPNQYDCGVYVLQYADAFFRKPITDFTKDIHDLRYWFAESDVMNKRCEIYNFIIDYVKQNFPENSQHIPKISFIRNEHENGEISDETMDESSHP